MYRIAVSAVSLSFAALGLLGCPADNDVPDDAVTPEAAARSEVKRSVGVELSALSAAAVALQAAAPAPDADGWNADDDAAAVDAMRTEWKKARVAYERVEGAIAVLFPELDESTDQRYDGFHEDATFTDDNLFDGEGVIGIHGIERILYSDDIDPAVLTFEQGVVGARFAAPSFPTTEQEARDFKEGLVQRLVDDAAKMQRDFDQVNLALEAAYRGVLGSMEEQLEKVALAGEGADESRYARHTLGDMRANLEGGRAIFASFDEMFEAAGDEGQAVRADILAAFDRVDAAYAGLDTDAIPAVPATWNPEDPSEEDAASDYGQLFLLLSAETDFESPTSFVSLFLKGATLLDIPELPK